MDEIHTESLSVRKFETSFENHTTTTNTTQTTNKQRQTNKAEMSSANWEMVNGVRYPVGDPEEKPTLVTVEGKWEEGETFECEGGVWETIKEISHEEAVVIRDEQRVKKEWTQRGSQVIIDATDHELELAAFGEGIPPGQSSSTDESQETIVIYMDEEKVEMPFGFVEVAPFLELLWRKTGTDCDGEEDDMDFPWGETYRVMLCETRGSKL